MIDLCHIFSLGTKVISPVEFGITNCLFEEFPFNVISKENQVNATGIFGGVK